MLLIVLLVVWLLLLLLRIYCRRCGDHSGTGNINPLLLIVLVVVVSVIVVVGVGECLSFSTITKITAAAGRKRQ